MSRVRFKGGAWTNSEDEVLRASLTVYGLQNWERVASMLVRKTAAQCRERWESYLDPRLNIHEEWTADEEARLVQLQSLFSNQWNLIARELSSRGGMNRPAWLCEEHYHTLLDALEYEKQQQQRRRGEALTLEDFLAERKRQRATRLGHETKAARPDAADTESFEEEMVEFAVSRLANQDGKKGLRKERKKQLEHTSFLAKLQNNREAIESGTLSARAKKKMERAMLEDQSGPKGTRVQDSVIEDDEMGDEEDDEDNEGKVKKVFKSIDLAADKEAAGIQAKQRVLVKDLSAQNQKQQKEKGAVADGVDVAALLRLAGDPVATAQIEDKKKIYISDKGQKDPTGRTVAGKAIEKSVVDIDHLFAALPDIVVASPSTDVHTSSDATAVADKLFGSPSSPSASPVQCPRDPTAHTALSLPTSLSESPAAPINFTSPDGCVWLREAKRRVLVEAEMALVGGRRRWADRMACDANGNEDDDDAMRRNHGMDTNTRRIVEALVTNQMADTARDLLSNNSNSGNSGNSALCPQGARRKRSRGADVPLATESADGLAALVAAAAEEPEAVDFARGVCATEATVQLEELLRYQRQQVDQTVGAVRRRAERIVRICFEGEGASEGKKKSKSTGENDCENGSESESESESVCLRRACARSGAELEAAQRELRFYCALLETERREVKRRVDAAAKELAGLEAAERELQEQYHAMRLREGQ